MGDPFGERQPRAMPGETREMVRCNNPECAGPAIERGGKPALIAELVTAPWRIQCWRCKHRNVSG